MIPSYKTIEMFPLKGVNYDMTDVRRYEDYALKFLSFRLNYLTAYYILECFLSNGIIFNYEFKGDEIASSIKDRVLKTYRLSRHILRNFSYQIGFVNYNIIYIAYSCLMLAKELNGFKEPFNVELENLYDIKAGNFFKCYQYIQTYCLLI